MGKDEAGEKRKRGVGEQANDAGYKYSLNKSGV